MKLITNDVKLVIGCDFHPSFQRIAILDRETGELSKKTLLHGNGEARRFYEGLRGQSVVVGIESCGNTLWFEQILAEMGHRLVIGDAARIRAHVVRRQKNDDRDALNILELLETERFPALWVPSPEERDLRALLLHRFKLVQMRTRIKNQLQHIALNYGFQKKRKLWSQEGRKFLQELELPTWTGRRRDDLLKMLEPLDVTIAELSAAVEKAVEKDARSQLLKTHPGVGPITALGFVLIIGPVERFARSRQVASYLGLIPTEDSSGGRHRWGHISKQGNTFLRTMLVEAGQTAARKDPELRRAYQRLKHKKQFSGIAKVMVARKLAIRLYWMLRTNQPYLPARMQGSPSHSVVEV
ncbi:MAG TPA: IS110 family transposase [Candidatus Angelobacter sp.]|nr:IS110 family transposase [Candidatus Angelobacter sp.]